MNPNINPHVKEIQISGIRQFFNRVQEYPEAMQLTLGQPDFPTPKHIKTAAKTALDKDKTTYTANAGTIELRKAASEWIQNKYELAYHPFSEIIVTAGASQAIDVAMRTILEPGDEVIVPAPVYPAYAPIIKQCGGIIKYADTRKSDFKLTPELIREHISPATKAIMIPYPSNPTGVVLSADEMQALYLELREKNIFIVADEIYSELCFDDAHRTIASYPGMKEKTILINGLSKSHSMTGWRIGFLFADASITQHLLKVHQYNISCASSISQEGALAALVEGQNDPEEMRETYQKRRNWMLSKLQEINIPVVKPGGAFYLFPDIRASGLSSFDFALQLLETEKLAVVPGDAFSEYGEGYIRISYAYSMEQLEESMERLERFWKRIIS
ncbi:aminotransferase A [Alkalicoccus daliensis]|uniref:Aminotransferase n=1 Tax=Alkalicoccus daliensis TaxID=745820 RepID=A0A1H0ANR3_9BACI|nr:aminotransferase A [Alkalicoccus daliensis]SDN35015.1 aminotransferase [Alkalicoccus daliensis]